MDYNNQSHQDLFNVLLSNYIQYGRMTAMTKYAMSRLMTEPESNSFIESQSRPCLNVFIDVYSLIRQIYNRFGSIMIKDSYAIASSFINLAIHIRSFFYTRCNGMDTKIYIIYGGAKTTNVPTPDGKISSIIYNEKNNLMEQTNSRLYQLILDNLKIMEILCPYLNDIFCINDYTNEFISVASKVIDMYGNGNINIIYSKDPMAYQLVPFKSKTFLFRPKKKNYGEDVSWVVTKSVLYNSYRYDELELKLNEEDSRKSLNINLFPVYLAISGVKSRGLNSIKNASLTFKLLHDAVASGVFTNGFNTSSIYRSTVNPLSIILNDELKGNIALERLMHIDLKYLDIVLYNTGMEANIIKNVTNLCDPREVQFINNRYFIDYPLDLNRV